VEGSLFGHQSRQQKIDVQRDSPQQVAAIVQSVPVSVRHVTYHLPFITSKVLNELLVKSSINRLKLKLLILSYTSLVFNTQIHPFWHAIIQFQQRA
jgi:hypothetical protein